MYFDIGTVADRIKLIQFITDKQLEEDISYCLFLIEKMEKHNFPDEKITSLANDLNTLKNEVNKRWWNRIVVSDKVSYEDLTYIKHLVQLRDVQAHHYLRWGGRFVDGMFFGLDTALNAFKEIKGI